MSSYLVLARKYRPKTFGEVIGQEVVTEVLRGALTGGHLGHAYLFAGPRGTGKTTLARLRRRDRARPGGARRGLAHRRGRRARAARRGPLRADARALQGLHRRR